MFVTRWWFQTFCIFIPTWGRLNFWLIFDSYCSTGLKQPTRLIWRDLSFKMHCLGLVIDWSLPKDLASESKTWSCCQMWDEDWVVATHMFFIFTLIPGLSWSNLTTAHSFQMGWFNGWECTVDARRESDQPTSAMKGKRLVQPPTRRGYTLRDQLT